MTLAQATLIEDAYGCGPDDLHMTPAEEAAIDAEQDQ